MSVPCGRGGQVGAGMSENVKGRQGWRSVGVDERRVTSDEKKGTVIQNYRQLE